MIVAKNKKSNPDTPKMKSNSIDELFHRARNYESSNEYIETMDFIMKLKNLSPFNAWLIYKQNPCVSHVATARYWERKFKRTIKPNAKPYVIMMPFAPVNFVYDVLDTEGKELPIDIKTPFRAKGEAPKTALQSMLQCCTTKNIKVVYDETLDPRAAGWASHNSLNKTKQITINANHEPEVQLSTLIHELAHLMLGHCGSFIDCECIDRSHLPISTKEIEAETVSWLVSNRFGIETNADKYLKDYIKDTDAFRKISLKNLLTTADKIENVIINQGCEKKEKKAK